jgi:hypothetical protein
MAVMFMSLGESCTMQNGRLWGPQTITDKLQEARRLTGEPKRKGYNQSHIPAFLEAFGSAYMKPKSYLYWRDRKPIRESLQGPFVITMAGDVAGTPAGSKLRRYVNAGVGHELIFFDWEGDWRTGTVAVIDPMQAQDTGQYVRRVPASEMWAFGSRFRAMGLYCAERWKIGSQTRAARVAKDRAAVILDLQQKVLKWREYSAELDAENDSLVDKYNELDAKCKDGGVPITTESEVADLLQEAINKLNQ